MNFLLSKYDKIKMLLIVIEALCASVGGALVISEGHPLTSVSLIALAAAAGKLNNYLDKKQV